MRTNDRHESLAPEVTLRIPGAWSGPAEFIERLPRGCSSTAEALVLVDGSEFELNVLPADDEFPRIFAGSCPKLPTESEREQIEDYKVNVCLTGRGGSIDSAKRIMAAAGVVLAAGGAGVFVDNSGIAHGATDWLTLLDGADDGGVYWAFVSTVRSDEELYSIGMHILGFRDAIIPSTGNDEFDAGRFTAFSGSRRSAALRFKTAIWSAILSSPLSTPIRKRTTVSPRTLRCSIRLGGGGWCRSTSSGIDDLDA